MINSVLNKVYKHIFFDLDHTLWDYDANAASTLFKLYDKYDLGQYGIESRDLFFEVFVAVNEDLWAKFDLGKIDKFYLRNERFRLVFYAARADMLRVTDQTLSDFNKDFLRECPKNKSVLPGSLDILEYLNPKYELHIITNGFEEVQQIKLEHAGLHTYFGKVITSQKAGFKKPFPGIFNYAMKHCKAHPASSVMIGDNLNTDIKGARDFGMDHIYFNPEKIAHDQSVTQEISHLMELTSIL